MLASPQAIGVWINQPQLQLSKPLLLLLLPQQQNLSKFCHCFPTTLPGIWGSAPVGAWTTEENLRIYARTHFSKLTLNVFTAWPDPADNKIWCMFWPLLWSSLLQDGRSKKERKGSMQPSFAQFSQVLVDIGFWSPVAHGTTLRTS